MLTLEQPKATGGIPMTTQSTTATCGSVLGITGHRPHKLAPKPRCYSKQFRVELTKFAMGLLEEIKPEQVISGMALGWDQAVAIAAIKLEIPLVAAVPFQGQESQWPTQSKQLYQKILGRAAHVEIVSSGGYPAQAMQARNEWIVDNSNQLLALCDPARPGETQNCLVYAYRKRIPVTHCWDTFKLKF